MAWMLRARVQSRPPSWPEPQQTLDSQTTAAFFERRLCRQYVQKLGLTSERWPANRRPAFAQHKWHFGREDECHNIPICVCKAFSGCDPLSVSNASGKQHNGNLLNGNVSIYRNIFRANSKLCWQTRRRICFDRDFMNRNMGHSEPAKIWCINIVFALDPCMFPLSPLFAALATVLSYRIYSSV